MGTGNGKKDLSYIVWKSVFFLNLKIHDFFVKVKMFVDETGPLFSKSFFSEKTKCITSLQNQNSFKNLSLSCVCSGLGQGMKVGAIHFTYKTQYF
jgi:hypothetical protein